MSTDRVTAWAETVSIPTYGTGAPSRNPMFLERRVYQGSSGVVYPLPVIDQVYDDRRDHNYTALFLENRYLRIMILPELGGRVQMALDKTNDYHFVYYNRVIKPALVGLAGPWISGGIEFNWPQHHRPTTFAPLDWRIVENEGGSSTIWCAEIEPMFHTKGMHGFTLYPDRAVLEVEVRLYNRTDLPQTFLWWANPAVAVDAEYQTVFPPDVTAVMDHGKRDVATFPIATGIYYKHDYAPGTDIRWYRNIPVPTSYMAYRSDFDFVGGYDHGRQAGMLHVADHHSAPGKKMWTWGNGSFGEAWNRHLTDEDGPYIELMCGTYTDNQPDFSWIEPGEEKRFVQTFLPYKQIGPPENASTEALLRLTVEGESAEIGVYVTRPRAVRVRLFEATHTLYEQTHALSPTVALRTDVPLQDANPDALRLEAWDGDTLLLSCAARLTTRHPIPAPATAAPPPEEIASNEELYLHGLHLEQYRHATWDPEPYYREALRRDPLDSRANNTLGLLLYRSGRFTEAEACFRNAVARLTTRNANPHGGESFYNLGLALRMLGRDAEAMDAFRKAMWDGAWVAAAGTEAARLATRAKDTDMFNELMHQITTHAFCRYRAEHLDIAFCRTRGMVAAARSRLNGLLDLDPMGYGALHEVRLLVGTSHLDEHLKHPTPNVAVNLAIDYAWGGFYRDAIDLLRGIGDNRALPLYLCAWVQRRAGDAAGADATLREAAHASTDFVFPNHLEEYLALEEARRFNPVDALAAYALGNFLYAHRRKEEALVHWEEACRLDPDFATAQRNLGLALANVRSDLPAALARYERACALDPEDARLLFELDQLRRRMNLSLAERLRHLDGQLALVLARDDLAIEYVTLLNLTGAHDRALEVIASRTFHPWEGGEGKVATQYVHALAAQARRTMDDGDYERAVALLERALLRPPHLGEGKLEGARENDIHYLLGCAWRALQESVRAEDHFLRACEGSGAPALALAYYDQPPDMIFYQGLALRALGKGEEARVRFHALLDYGRAHESDDVQIDYFAVSLPEFSLFEEPIDLRHRIHCLYMIALGALGLGDRTDAADAFERLLALDASHQGALLHRDWRANDL